MTWYSPKTKQKETQKKTHLVDLVIQDTNGTPESGVSRVTIDGLLVGLVSLVVILFGHVASAQEIP